MICNVHMRVVMLVQEEKIILKKIVLGHYSSQALSRIKKGNQSLSLFRLQLDNLSKDCFQTFLDAENSQKASKNRKIMIFPKQEKQNKNNMLLVKK